VDLYSRVVQTAGRRFLKVTNLKELSLESGKSTTNSKI
jgi:hypothetical protein